MSSRLRGGIALLIGLLLLGRSEAAADARTDARRHFDEGMALIRQNQVAPGIAALRLAYDTFPHPGVLYNIGVAYARIGQWEAAADAFDQYVESDPPDRDDVERLAAELRARSEAERGAPPPTPTPRESPAAAPAVDVADEDLQALEESALQAETLAEVSQGPDSPALRARAERLRLLASELRAIERGEGGTEPAEPLEPGGERPAVPGPAVPERGQETIYEETVVSASRATESPVNAPNSVAIITAQDIRLSGLHNLPEILRRAAGVDVFQSNPYGSQVSVRGLNDGINPRILVLVNGRSVYWDFLGSTQYHAIPIALEDIERIEIIRGPASALYGADAFTGIINILTRDPGEGGTYVTVSAGGGDGFETRAVLGVSGRVDRFSYHFNTGYERSTPFVMAVDENRVDLRSYLRDPAIDHQRAWAGGDLRYNLGEGYYVRAGSAFTVADPLTLAARGDVRYGHARNLVNGQTYVSLTTPFGLGLRSFWNHLSTDFDVPGITDDIRRGQQRETIRNAIEIRSQEVVDVEAELSRRFELGVPHQLIIGAGYRFKSVDWDWLGPRQSEHHFSAFLQDTVEITRWFDAVASLRYDRHPLIDELLLSPRGSLIFHPTEQSGIRLQVGTAFRSPTFIESYFSLDAATPFRGVFAHGEGSTELEPERMLSFEIGYTTQDSEYLTFEANVYLNYVSDLIRLQQGADFTLGEFVSGERAYDPSLEAYPAVGLNIVNLPATYRQVGGEIGIRLYPVQGLDVYTNYAIHDTRPFEEDRIAIGPEAADRRTSRHKLNVGIQYRSTFGLDLSADVHAYSEQRWVLPDGEGGFETLTVPAFVILNARIGYRLVDDRLELGVVGTNLLFQDVRQHPWGQPIGTRVLGEVTLHL